MTGRRSGSDGHELLQEVPAGPNDPRRGLRYLVPRSRKVAEGLGYHQPSLWAQLGEDLDFGVQLAERVDLGGEVEGSAPAFARVPESPDRLPIARRHRALE